MLTFSQFDARYLGRSVWSACTGNQAAGIRPQCLDLVDEWSRNKGKGCFPRRGDADDVFNNADAAKWIKIRNTPNGVPRQGDIIVMHTAHPQGHVAIDRGGSTIHIVNTLDQNYSSPNRVTHEQHHYTGATVIIGWLRAR